MVGSKLCVVQDHDSKQVLEDRDLITCEVPKLALAERHLVVATSKNLSTDGWMHSSQVKSFLTAWRFLRSGRLDLTGKVYVRSKLPTWVMLK
jgi:hypothetical protein